MDLYYQSYYDLEVRDTQKMGKGLFAKEAIERNCVVFKFGGKLLLNSGRYNENVIRSTCIGVNEEVILCSLVGVGKDPTDFLNHSCEPNIGMKDAITVVAIRDIMADEELLIDYCFWEGRINWDLGHLCNCGSATCRRSIVGAFHTEIDAKYKYFEYFSPFIKTRIISRT